LSKIADCSSSLYSLTQIPVIPITFQSTSLSVYLEPELAHDPVLVKNVQQELPYTSLRTVTAAVKIWYDPVPTETIIPEDKVFIESFFAIPDEEIESKLHLQSPWLLCLELDRAKIIDRKLTMAYFAGSRAESFKTIYSSSGVKTIWKSLSFIVVY